MPNETDANEKCRIKFPTAQFFEGFKVDRLEVENVADKPFSLNFGGDLADPLN
jgi:hypothetical protein